MIERINIFLFHTKFEYFFFGIIFLIILTNGVWFSPATERVLLISEDIFSNPFINKTTNQWLLGSFLGPVLGYILDMNKSIFLFSLMHLLIFIMFFYLLLRKIENDNRYIARYILLAFFMMPISNIVFTWLGYADVFTVLLGVSLVIFRNNKIVLFANGFLFGINHFEQGVVVVFVLFVFYFFAENKVESFRFLLTSTIGILLGYIGLQIYFYIHDFNINFYRLDYIDNAGIFRYLRALFSNFFAEIFSFFNIFSFFIGYLFYKTHLHNKKILQSFVGGTDYFYGNNFYSRSY